MKKEIGILPDKETSRCVKDFWAISGRILLVKLHGRPFNIFIQSYAPTADHSEELDNAYKQCKSEDVVYVTGNFNEKVGNERIGNTVGPFSRGDKNDRDNLVACPGD